MSSLEFESLYFRVMKMVHWLREYWVDLALCLWLPTLGVIVAIIATKIDY